MIESFGSTDIGRRRQLNEDSLLVDDDAGVYVVADGMGGHNAGEVASRLAVEVVRNFIRRSREDDEITWPYGIEPSLSFNANRLRTAVLLANKRIWKEAESRKDYSGMGTTIVAALADGNTMTLASAGDSRCYRYRQRRLEQLTVDDSLVQTAVSQGVLDQGQLAHHPMRNIITKALGARETIDPSLREETLEEGDIYLLCSDGLHGMLSDETIRNILASACGDLEGAVRELVAQANERGGKDNITVAICRYRGT